jgi:hypothetical protein
MKGLIGRLWVNRRCGALEKRIFASAPSVGIRALASGRLHRRKRRRAARGISWLEYNAEPLCRTPQHAAKLPGPLGRNDQIEFRGYSNLAFDLQRGAVRRNVADDAVDPRPIEGDRSRLEHAPARTYPLFAHGKPIDTGSIDRLRAFAWSECKGSDVAQTRSRNQRVVPSL